MPHGKLKEGGGTAHLKTIWLIDHICSLCLFLAIFRFKFYYPGAFAPNRLFFCCLGINLPLLFIPHFES